jgi:hypothetical protein
VYWSHRTFVLYRTSRGLQLSEVQYTYSTPVNTAHRMKKIRIESLLVGCGSHTTETR